MLRDEDRIFTNLYGQDDWGIEGARKRGSWDNTKALLDLGREELVERVKASGLRGRGGAGALRTEAHIRLLTTRGTQCRRSSRPRGASSTVTYA